MTDTVGNSNKCTFCPNTQDVKKTSLGGIDTYMCAACARKVVEEFVLQGFDLVQLDKLFSRVGQTITLRFLDQRKDVHIGSNVTILVDDMTQFFQGTHAMIVSGRLRELREKQTALRRLRDERMGKEEQVKAIDEANEGVKDAAKKAQEDLQSMQEKCAQLARDLESGIAAKSQALAQRRELEVREAQLAHELSKLLGEPSNV